MSEKCRKIQINIFFIFCIKDTICPCTCHWEQRDYRESPKWNFYKFFFDKNVKFVESWTSMTRPDKDKKIILLINQSKVIKYYF